MMGAREWYEFADRLEKTAIRMFEDLELPTSEQKDTYAVTLLARTVSNFNGVMVLLNKDLVVEARALVRCCWENAFYFAGIVRSGDDLLNKFLKMTSSCGACAANGCFSRSLWNGEAKRRIS